MSEGALRRLVGISAEERRTVYADVGLFNHHWDRPGTMTLAGMIPAAEIEALSRGMLVQNLSVTSTRGSSTS